MESLAVSLSYIKAENERNRPALVRSYFVDDMFTLYFLLYVVAIFINNALH